MAAQNDDCLRAVLDLLSVKTKPFVQLMDARLCYTNAQNSMILQALVLEIPIKIFVNLSCVLC